MVFDQKNIWYFRERKVLHFNRMSCAIDLNYWIKFWENLINKIVYIWLEPDRTEDFSVKGLDSHEEINVVNYCATDIF